MPLTFEDLKTREGVTPAPRIEKKGLVEKVGGFLAPTTTGLLTGEKEVSGRTLLGAGLEVGSFALPSTALLKIAGLFGKGARVAGLAARVAGKGAKVAKIGAKVAPAVEDVVPLTFEALATRTGQIGRKVVGQAKTTAKIGGVAGTMFGAGRALGEEETPLTQVAGQAALGGLAGAVGGAVLAPVISLTTMGASKVAGVTSNSIKSFNRLLKPADRAAIVEQKTSAYIASHVEDAPAINNALDRIMVKSRRVGGPTTKEGLVREVVEEGLLPKVEGIVGNQRPNIDFLATERGRLANKIDPILEPIKKKTSLITLKGRVETFLTETIGIDDKTANQINHFFDKKFLTQYGANITPKQINEIRKEMNKLSGAFDKEGFQLDVQYAIAHIMRDALDKVVPSKLVRGINAEIGRLFRMEETLRAFHNKKLNVGPVAQAFGRYAGIAALAGPLGFVSGVLGPLAGGSILIAGIAAQMGSKFVSQLVRNSRFNPQVIALLRKGINRDQQLKAKLLKEATKADRALLEKVFGSRVLGKKKATEVAGQSAKVTQIPKELEPLAQEARKYKSVEEFVESGQYVRHRTSPENASKILKEGFDVSKTTKNQFDSAGVFVNKLSGFEESIKGDVVLISKANFKNPLVLDLGAGLGPKPLGGVPGWKVELQKRYGGLKGEKLRQALLKDGYDSIITKEGKDVFEMVSLDPQKNLQPLGTKSQLTDFYKQAVKGK